MTREEELKKEESFPSPLRVEVRADKVDKMSREEKLKQEGWEKRFTIDEPHLSEMVEQYKELGFEVRLEPVDTSSEECTECLTDPVFSDRYKTIYTRKK